ncbi:beta-glucosidase [Allocatelliglobosispora scoriae]|uniref:Exo-alpha-(1->6)-L-arabinopyranosidase n=1 Tax=Allocatelliglobosispora scoriae TaxID=643052 RepID=A0A841BU74_9ACTN|nr:glycoside hydrolase family 3 protein [Allocatelliglobosispora scoriae]MBB5871754.1 beta-glucosidase [Allocatelliglobosispora scoriae]
MDFRNAELPLPHRVADLLARLTPAEKVAMLHQHQPAIHRLDVAAFSTGTEALHGLAWLGEATVFPQAVGLGATWSPELVRAVGDATGDEVRELHHTDPTRCGLNVWAPVVNPLRDPRWGRNEEGYSEDAFLTAAMGAAYSWGLRGDHPRYLKTAPTLKHFLGYNNETDRCRTDSNLGPRVLHEYELPAYRRAISEGAAVAVMAAYNLVNGSPAHVTPLINDELRGWTDDEVFVVSDAYAPNNLADPAQQDFFADHATSHAAALLAGIDSFTDQGTDSQVTIGRFEQALAQGLITEADVDRAVSRALTIRFRLGEFDAAEGNPFVRTAVDQAEHRRLAREAARESIVLLKSECKLLPLDPAQHRTVAVIGSHADHLFTDWYSGTLPYAVTPLNGLRTALGAANVTYAEGTDRIALRYEDRYLVVDADGARLSRTRCEFDAFDWGHGVVTLRSTATGRFVRVDADGALTADSPGPSEWVVREMFRLVEQGDGTVELLHHASDGNPTTEIVIDGERRVFDLELVIDGAVQAAEVAAAADAAIVLVGNHPLVNGRETEDRLDLALSPAQDRLIREVYAANQSTAAVLVSSYPYAAVWAEVNLPAVLWTSHGGQELGNALAEVLTGAADPGGRLPQTWYRSVAELPDLLDYDIITNDATYLYYRGTPLYPFGHGLSHTTFDYSALRLSAESAIAGETVRVSLTVTNVGLRPGTEVVQAYTHQQRSRVKQPLRQLRAFAKLTLAPGESREVSLDINVDDFAFWDVTTGAMVVESARHKVMVGRSSADIRLTATLAVRGTTIAARRAADGPVAVIGHDEYCGITPAAAGVKAVEAGAWLCFHNLSLSGVRQAALSGTGRSVTLRLDDPFAGQVLATVTPGGPLAQASSVDGVHDLYLIFDAPDTTATDLVLR